MSSSRRSNRSRSRGHSRSQSQSRSRSQSQSPKPTPPQIIALATIMGYHERRPEVSKTLFFTETDPAHGMAPVLINVYYTTRSIMTFMNHPTAGMNEMWRSNAYQNLDELKEFLVNPRMHSGKGYRNKNKAVRGCSRCGKFKERSEYSSNQWVKGPDLNKCKDCVTGHTPAASVTGPSNSWDVDGLAISLDRISLIGNGEVGGDRVHLDDNFPSLTSDLLSAHNKQPGNGNDSSKNKSDLESRQFNCPECPKYGRGKHVFFKKVPKYKPIVKCPKCKRASRGRCKRIHPIPKSMEKGYGLYRCTVCKDKWGSSRAVRGIGQACYSCDEKGHTIFVKPFRLEAIKKTTSKNRGGILGGPRGSMRRVPKETIEEYEETETPYSAYDQNRNANAGGNALSSGGFNSGEGRSFDYEPRDDETETVPQPPVAKIGVPRTYVHKCEGCSKGLCKSRYLPKSEVQDVSDGNTVSTSSSIATNSSVDKGEFIDRDEDFNGFQEDVEEEWHVVTI